MKLHRYFREPHGIPWNSTIFPGIPWTSKETPWNFMAFHGTPLLLHGTPWNSMAFHGTPWILHGYSMGVSWNSMDFHRFPWNSMDFHRFPWISMEFHEVFRTGKYELLKCQMLLNGHLQITCIGIGKNSLAHYELACSKRSGQWREMGNGGKQTLKRVRGKEQKDLLPSLPNPAPSPLFPAHFFLTFLFPKYLKAGYRLNTCIPSFPTFYGIYST